MKTWKCIKCKKTKSVREFYKRWYNTNSRGRVQIWQSECKSCCIISAKKRYRYDEKGTRAKNLKQNFGISLEEYKQMLQNQNGVCDICGLVEIAKTKEHLSVDHNHKTGKVRGLLCNRCNVGLGAFGDDVDVMASAISYLINNKAKKAG